MALTNKLTAIANAIRAKTGKTEPLTLDQMPTEIASISGGGSSGGLLTGEIDIPVLVPQISFEVTAEHYYPYALYNGVRLPRIPDSVLASYPYAWIRDNRSTGYYDLLLAQGVWYCSDTDTLAHNDAKKVEWYRIEKATASSATAWTFNQSYDSKTWGEEANRPIMWSNHDIPNGSANATDIYFVGSEPVLTD
jgi:hypothetical protein